MKNKTLANGCVNLSSYCQYLTLFVQLYHIHVTYCFGLKLQLGHAFGRCKIHVMLNLYKESQLGIYRLTRVGCNFRYKNETNGQSTIWVKERLVTNFTRKLLK